MLSAVTMLPIAAMYCCRPAAMPRQHCVTKAPLLPRQQLAAVTCGRNCHCCREHYPRQHLLRTQDADAQGTTSRSCGTRSAPAPTVSDRQWCDWCRWCVLLSRGSRSGFAGDRWYKVWTEETRQQYITPTGSPPVGVGPRILGAGIRFSQKIGAGN